MTPAPKEDFPRRSTHREMPVGYAAVGASRAPDLVRFPPAGSTSYEETLQLGSGEERFILASSWLMTWGAHRGAGCTVEEIDRGEGDAYTGVIFDADGTPVPTGNTEELFGPDGEPYVTAGTQARLRIGDLDREVLVVYTLVENNRVGFAWGDRSDDGGPYGEHFAVVELKEDGTVWAGVRGFFFSSQNGIFGLKARNDQRNVLDAAKRILAALLPGVAPVNTLPDAGADESAAPAGMSDVDASVDVQADEPIVIELPRDDSADR